MSPRLPFTTPVLLLVFNRPGTTKQVFEKIRKAKPAKLYIVADGPREGNADDAIRCAETKRIVTDVNWPCEVHTLFREKNLGLGEGLSTGISWFFENESEGIILEDDCLPAASFFSFCQEMLERYRHDSRVAAIGGNCLENPVCRDEEYSYSFSAHTYIWGWATWKRAWKLHDFYMHHYPEINQKKYLHQSYDSIYERDYFQYVFEKMHQGDERTNRRTVWDYQWQFACMINSGLVIVPNRNLVSNVGFGNDATHTRNSQDPASDLPLEEMIFPLKHPEFVMADKLRDSFVFMKFTTSLSSRLKSQARLLIPRQVIDKVIVPLKSLLFSNS